MGGKMSRNKGARGEREIIKLLQPVVNKHYATFELEPPKLVRNTLQWADGGADVHASSPGLDWLSLEIKFHETYQLNQWWLQTCQQTKKGQFPVLLYRRSRVKWRCQRLAYESIGGERISTRIDTDFDAFLNWFTRVLNWRLKKFKEAQHG